MAVFLLGLDICICVVANVVVALLAFALSLFPFVLRLLANPLTLTSHHKLKETSKMEQRKKTAQ